MTWALLIGCTAKLQVGEAPPESPPGGGDSAPGREDSVVEQVPGAPWTPEPCDALYDPAELPVFEVEISDAEWEALLADYRRGEKDDHPITFRWGEEEAAGATIRLKGNPDFSWFTEKMQFVIAFNQLDPEGRFRGLRKLSLDAPWYDPTLLRDRVAWGMLGAVEGLPTPCANTAALHINGAYYGLYTHIEYLDREWLERVFGDAGATGTLYKYGYDPVSNAEAATGAAEQVRGTSKPARLAQLGDVEQWLAAWAAEIVVGSDDGYWCCDHNYYLYEHPARGVLWVPWDLDNTYDTQPYDTDPVRGYAEGSWLFQQAQFHALVEDPTWGPVFLDQLERLSAAFDPALVLPEVERADAQLRELLEDDPHRSFVWEEHEEALQRLQRWVPARHAYLQSWLACARGSTADADADGAPVCADPDDGDPAVYPGAPERCDGVDNDADGWVDDDPACEDCVRRSLDGTELLFCRWPRTNTDAKANCSRRGATLDGPQTSAERTMVWFYAWPVFEDWWTGGGSGGSCQTWDEAAGGPGSAPCAEEHPSVCRVR